MKQLLFIALISCYAGFAFAQTSTSTVNTPSNGGTGSINSGQGVVGCGPHCITAGSPAAGNQSAVHTTSTVSALVDTTAQVWPCDATSGNVTLTLPVGSTVANYDYEFVKIDATPNYCAVQASGSDTINYPPATEAYAYAQGEGFWVKNKSGTTTWILH